MRLRPVLQLLPQKASALLTPPHTHTHSFTQQSVVQTIRKLRCDYSLTRQRPSVFVTCADAGRAAALTRLASEAATLSTSGGVEVLAAGAAAPAGCSVAIVDDVTTVHMLLKVGAARHRW